jgi:hypothetical protein
MKTGQISFTYGKPFAGGVVFSEFDIAIIKVFNETMAGYRGFS